MSLYSILDDHERLNGKPPKYPMTEALNLIRDIDVAVIDPWSYARAMRFFDSHWSHGLTHFDIQPLLQFSEALMLHEYIIVPAEMDWVGEVPLVPFNLERTVSNIIVREDVAIFFQSLELESPIYDTYNNAFHARRRLACTDERVKELILRQTTKRGGLADESFPYIVAPLNFWPTAATDGTKHDTYFAFQSVVARLLNYLQFAEVTYSTLYPSASLNHFQGVAGDSIRSAVAKNITDRYSAMCAQEVEQVSNLLGTVMCEMVVPFWLQRAFRDAATSEGVLNILLELRNSDPAISLRGLALELRNASRSHQMSIANELKKSMEEAMRGSELGGTIVSRVITLLPAVWNLDIPRLMSEATTIHQTIDDLRSRRKLIKFFRMFRKSEYLSSLEPDFKKLYGHEVTHRLIKGESPSGSHYFDTFSTTLPDRRAIDAVNEMERSYRWANIGTNEGS